MGNLWLNLRIWVYHFQAGENQWWKISISRNDYHLKNNQSSFVQLYDLRWPKSYIGGRNSVAQGKPNE